MADVVTGGDLGGRMSLMDHLVELRTRLIRCVVAVAIGGVLGWFAFDPVIDILRVPLQKLSDDPNVSDKFLALDPLEVFMLRIKMSAYLGIALSMPVILWQVWKFVAPGLYQNERRYATAFVAMSTLLFALGAALAYFTLPAALDFLKSMGGGNVVFQFSLEKYVTLILYMMLAFGVGFQFPIVVVFLQLVGIVEPDQLAKFRRFAIVIIFVLGAIITPSADPISLIALAVPMVLFYEVSIIIGRLILRSRRRNAG